MAKNTQNKKGHFAQGKLVMNGTEFFVCTSCAVNEKRRGAQIINGDQKEWLLCYIPMINDIKGHDDRLPPNYTCGKASTFYTSFKVFHFPFRKEIPALPSHSYEGPSLI